MADSLMDEGATEEQILRDLATNKQTSPEDAVERIVNMTKELAAGKGLGSHCYYTASALVETAAVTTPDQHPKLVSFLNQLRIITLTDPKLGGPLIYDGDIVWKDMPTFGYTIADALGACSFNVTAEEHERRLENLVPFFARFDATVGPDEPDINFTRTWALGDFRFAFGDGVGDELDEASVRLACLWYIYDADKMWRNVPEVENYTLTLWQKRKRGLKEARIVFAQRQSTVELIDRALVEIRRVER